MTRLIRLLMVGILLFFAAARPALAEQEILRDSETELLFRQISTPLVEGGNYGWRIFEGSQCTGIDPALCRTGNYIAPTLEYSHGTGRCSVTGGYAYRGIRFTFIWATYVYGDFCSGEVFTWDGVQQRVVVDTNMNIASFGEDEDGEIFVVDLGGTIGRLARR